MKCNGRGFCEFFLCGSWRTPQDAFGEKFEDFVDLQFSRTNGGKEDRYGTARVTVISGRSVGGVLPMKE